MKLWPAVLLLLALSPLTAQISQSLVDADTLTVGARFQLILKADFPLSSVSIPDSLDGFAVLGKDLVSDKGSQPYFKITLSPLKTGALSFPPLKVHGKASDYFSNGFRINVLAVRAEQDSTLRDIKPLRKYPLQRPLWFYLILPLALLAFLIWILSQRKKQSAAKPVTIAPKSSLRVLTPWEAALQELDQLEAENLLQKEDLAAFHFSLSMILRRFLELQYHVAAQEMTTLEIRAALARIGLDTDVETTGFLLYCDQVKFARVVPSSQEIDSKLLWLRKYLESFKPKAPEAAHVPLG